MHLSFVNLSFYNKLFLHFLLDIFLIQHALHYFWCSVFYCKYVECEVVYYTLKKELLCMPHSSFLSLFFQCNFLPLHFTQFLFSARRLWTKAFSAFKIVLSMGDCRTASIENYQKAALDGNITDLRSILISEKKFLSWNPIMSTPENKSE